MTPLQRARLCFPLERRSRQMNGTIVCELCWSVVPVGTTDDPDRSTSLDGLSPMQSQHVNWHSIVGLS